MTRAHDRQRTLPQRRCTSCMKTPSASGEGDYDACGTLSVASGWARPDDRGVLAVHVVDFP